MRHGKDLLPCLNRKEASQVTQWWRTCLPMQEMRVWSLGQKDPLKKKMATHSSILTWEIPWTEEPCGLQSVVSKRVGCDLATKQEHGKPCIFICNLYELCFMEYSWVTYHSFFTQPLGNKPNRSHTYIGVITLLLIRDLVFVIHFYVRNCPPPKRSSLK